MPSRRRSVVTSGSATREFRSRTNRLKESKSPHPRSLGTILFVSD
jgi:hypothetical protein